MADFDLSQCEGARAVLGGKAFGWCWGEAVPPVGACWQGIPEDEADHLRPVLRGEQAIAGTVERFSGADAKSSGFLAVRLHAVCVSVDITQRIHELGGISAVVVGEGQVVRRGHARESRGRVAAWARLLEGLDGPAVTLESTVRFGSAPEQ